MQKTIIADASCLIVLKNIRVFDLLQQVYGEITITDAVAKEFGLPLPSWIKTQAVKDETKVKELLRFIDAGEASSIVLAQETENSFLILDDYDARIIASKFGISYTGTIGVILKGKELGILKSEIDFIKELKSAGFWMSKELEERLLKDTPDTKNL